MLTTIGPTLSPWPSSALLAFVRRQVAGGETYLGDDRRAEPRHLLVMPVIVQGVDDFIAPLGEPQAMVIRDYSGRGLGLVHEQPFEHRRIAVMLTFPEEGTIVAAEVRWSKPLGPFNHLGCEIVGKLKAFPGLDE
jgi:PilZ domain